MNMTTDAIMPNKNDVLLMERGNAKQYDHYGNVQLQLFAAAISARNNSCAPKNIVLRIQSLSPPGRFLKRFAGKRVRWEIASDKDARKMVSKILRRTPKQGQECNGSSLFQNLVTLRNIAVLEGYTHKEEEIMAALTTLTQEKSETNMAASKAQTHADFMSSLQQQLNPAYLACIAPSQTSHFLSKTPVRHLGTSKDIKKFQSPVPAQRIPKLSSPPKNCSEEHQEAETRDDFCSIRNEDRLPMIPALPDRQTFLNNRRKKSSQLKRESQIKKDFFSFRHQRNNSRSPPESRE